MAARNDSYHYSVKLGVVDLDSTRQGSVRQVSRKYVHYGYDDTQLFNDIALLYFTTPIVMNDYVRPVCLSSSFFYQDLLNQGPNAECYISGWGDAEHGIFYDEGISHLQMTRVQLIANEECMHLRDWLIQDTVVCVDNSNVGSPSCYVSTKSFNSFVEIDFQINL
ncbi:hypothetical protein CHS0354_008144 [Potamilus streckersoni]|uniref:Peptidase S1 domain-containing protein n=1 Tax=Potamilus streckersoni TaxID=2493646 RepID=A0AAE0SJ13_9BIVA|nr:hypothetical protein CHS0354_008144 [Potamilus streckersoni]